jgi:hypothetical protein
MSFSLLVTDGPALLPALSLSLLSFSLSRLSLTYSSTSSFTGLLVLIDTFSLLVTVTLSVLLSTSPPFGFIDTETFLLGTPAFPDGACRGVWALRSARPEATRGLAIVGSLGPADLRSA